MPPKKVPAKAKSAETVDAPVATPANAPTTRIDIKLLERRSLAPEIPNLSADLKKLLPKITGEYVAYELNGVDNSVANAIRRTIMGEMYVNVIDMESLTTNDEYIIPDVIARRLRMLPLMQSYPVTEFTLSVTNNTAAPMDVMTSSLKPKVSSKISPFNDMVLLTLKPGGQIDITAKTGSAIEYEDGAAVVATSVSAIQLDTEMPNVYDGIKGVSSSVSRPMKWKLFYYTRGTEGPHDIFSRACLSIVDRVEVTRSLLNSQTALKSHGDQHTLLVPNETDTIGNLYMRVLNDLYPTAKNVTYQINKNVREVSINFTHNADPREMINAASDRILDIFDQIIDGVNGL